MVRLLPPHLIALVVLQLAGAVAGQGPADVADDALAAARRAGCSAVDPFRALGSERYSCWTCGSSIEAAAARCKDVCLPDEMEDEAYAAREDVARDDDHQPLPAVGPPGHGVSPSPASAPAGSLSVGASESSLASSPTTSAQATAEEPAVVARPTESLPADDGASRSAGGTHSSASPSPSNEPFLSFEDWKALQFAAHGAQGTFASDDGMPPSVPSPSSVVDGSLLANGQAPASPEHAAHDWASGDDGTSDSVVRSTPLLSSGADSAFGSASSSPTAASMPPPLPSVKSPSRRFNYASLDCSARVHYSSPQTRSPSALLHKSKDRYMLTPCAASAHFVVIELCDEIRIDTLEVGNFEFFSSVVKDVRVRAGESEGDGREDEQDWKELGTFRLANLRGVQAFKFDPPTGFHRYIRLDFIGHYGSEYYCPVSLVRTYGLNQMEAYRYELGREAQHASNSAAMVASRDEDAAARVAAAVEPTPAPLAWAGVGEDDFPLDGLDLPERTSVEAREPPSPSSRQAADVDAPALAASPTESHILPYIYPTSEPASVAASRLARSAGLLRTEPSAASSSATPASAAQQQESEANTSASSSVGFAGTATCQDLSGDASSASSSVGSRSSSVFLSEVRSPTSAPSASSSPLTKERQQPSSSSVSPARPPLSTSASFLQPKQPVPSSSAPPPQRPAPQPPNHRAPQPQPPPPPVDSGESIYSSIVRRLAHLESTTTLATHYLEEQSRMVRAALQRLEQGLTTWKAGVESAEKNRWAGGLEGLRAQQERMLRSTTREWDAQRREFERERRELAHRLALMNSEITLHRWLLGGTLLLLLVLLACFFAIRIGSVEMVPVPEVVSRATQKIKEKNRRSVGDVQDALRRRAASPHLRGTPRPNSPTSPSEAASTPPLGGLIRPRIRHHSNTPTKRSFSLATAATTPQHLVAGRSVEVGRPRSILGVGGTSHRKAAAREAHIHTLAHARLQGSGHAKKRSLSSSVVGVPGDQTPKRRFGTPASHANVGLGIGNLDHGSSSDQSGGEGSSKGYDDGWTPASTTDDDSDTGNDFAFPSSRREMGALQNVKVPVVGSGLVSAG